MYAFRNYMVSKDLKDFLRDSNNWNVIESNIERLVNSVNTNLEKMVGCENVHYNATPRRVLGFLEWVQSFLMQIDVAQEREYKRSGKIRDKLVVYNRALRKNVRDFFLIISGAHPIRSYTELLEGRNERVLQKWIRY